MYRRDYWQEGYYIDNHMKFRCIFCTRYFILGEELLKGCRKGYPVCPYCGSAHVELVAWTLDEHLDELSSYMGCLAISYDRTELQETELEDSLYGMKETCPAFRASDEMNDRKGNMVKIMATVKKFLKKKVVALVDRKVPK